MHEELTRRRADFPILASSTYLVNHSLGAMHRDVPGRLAGYAAAWADRGVQAWPDWAGEMTAVADQVGRILGAPAGSVVLRPNAAEALAAVASSLDFSGRAKVVYPDLEWPGTHYFWTEHARYGAEATPVAVSDDGVEVDIERLVDAIDERTALVHLSHVLFRTSTLLDVPAVVERAWEVGALVLLDAYQSAGSMPVEVERLGVDFCLGGSVKYLCGGPGNGWLYVRPALAETLRPATVGWWGHARPFDFEFGALEPAPGALRFAGGTPNVPAAFAAAPGYAAVLDAGLDRIRERSQSLTQPLVDGALDRGWTVRSPRAADRRGGHVTIDPGDSLRVHDELLARGFVVDHRPDAGIRIAPHFYNTAEECTAVLAAMAEVAGDGRG